MVLAIQSKYILTKTNKIVNDKAIINQFNFLIQKNYIAYNSRSQPQPIKMRKQQINKIIFTTTNSLKVQDFLRQNSNLDPRQYRDRKNNNVLHNMAFDSRSDIIVIYINHTISLLERKKYNDKQIDEQIKNWLDQKNNQGYTPLLYAAFNGNIEIIKYLQQRGADIRCTNNTKLNALHLAAQNNKVSTLIYFRHKIDYNQADSNGSTPLHWASFNGSEEVSAYLLSYPDIQLNTKNIEEQTPLFLATVYGNTKIVRRLLMKGADRTILNKKGQSPIQKAIESQFTNIAKMLNNNYTACDFLKFYYNVKVQYQPTQRSYIIPIVFFNTTIFSVLVVNGFLKFNQYYIYIFHVVSLLLMLSLYISLLWPPKYEQKQDIQHFIIDSRKVCFQCLRRRPRRGYHCDICHKCIQQYDHHCTWINNCVGKHNLFRFILFIFVLLVCLGFVGSSSVIGFIRLVFDQQKELLDNWISLRIVQEQYSWQYWVQVVLFFINIITSLFFIPVFMLFLVQLKNIITNKTTYESARGQASQYQRKMKQRQKVGIIQNCQYMCKKDDYQDSFLTDHSGQDQLLSH